MKVEYHYLDWDQSPERRAERGGGHTLKLGWEPALFTFQSSNRSILETPVLDRGEVDQGTVERLMCRVEGRQRGLGAMATMVGDRGGADTQRNGDLCLPAHLHPCGLRRRHYYF